MLSTCEKKIFMMYNNIGRKVVVCVSMLLFLTSPVFSAELTLLEHRRVLERAEKDIASLGRMPTDDHYYIEALVESAKLLDEQVPLIIEKTLTSESGVKRIRGLQVLGRIGDERAIPAMLDRFNYDFARDVRITAMQMLLCFGDMKAIERIEDEDMVFDEDFVMSLPRRKDPRIIEAMVATLRPISKLLVSLREMERGDPRCQEIKNELELLSGTSTDGMPMSWSVWWESVRGGYDLFDLNEMTDGKISVSRADSDRNFRGRIILLLGLMREHNAVAALRRLLRNKRQGVRVMAIQALGNIAYDGVLADLAECLDDESAFVQSHVIKAMGSVVQRRALEMAYARASRLWGDVPAFFKGYASNEIELKEYVSSSSGSPEAWRLIAWVMSSDSSKILLEDRAKLVDYWGAWLKRAEIKKSDIAISRAILEWIGRLRLANAHLYTKKWMKEGTSEGRLEAITVFRRMRDISVVNDLVSLVASAERDSALISRAWWALRGFSDDANQKATFLKKPTPTELLVLNQVRSLAPSKDGVPIEAIEASFLSEQPVVRRLGVFLVRHGDFPSLFPRLLNVINDKDKSVRIVAIQGLGELAVNGAAQQLLPLLVSQDADIRTASSDSLRKLKDTSVVENLVEALRLHDDVEIQKNIIDVLKSIVSEIKATDANEWLRWWDEGGAARNYGTQQEPRFD